MESKRGRPLVAVVDDNASVRRSIMRLVSSWGFDAAPFASGREFIDMLARFPSFNPDCAVLDLALPDMNGLEVQKRLKLLSPRVPVIFVTGVDGDPIRDEALASGAVAVFRKPIDDALFMTALTGIVKIS